MARGVKTDRAMIAIILVAMAGWYLLPRSNRDGTPAVDHLLHQTDAFSMDLTELFRI